MHLHGIVEHGAHAVEVEGERGVVEEVVDAAGAAYILGELPLGVDGGAQGAAHVLHHLLGYEDVGLIEAQAQIGT